MGKKISGSHLLGLSAKDLGNRICFLDVRAPFSGLGIGFESKDYGIPLFRI